MPRDLVVYYSRTGTTRKVGQQIASALDADLEEILDPTRRSGPLGFIRSGFEARYRRLPPIAAAERDPMRYARVVIGTPIWAGSVASPVRAYLRRYHASIREVAFFATCGGSGSQSAFRQMAYEYGGEPLARLVLRQDEIGTVTATLAIERFVAEVAGGWRPPRAPSAAAELRSP